MAITYRKNLPAVMFLCGRSRVRIPSRLNLA